MAARTASRPNTAKKKPTPKPAPPKTPLLETPTPVMTEREALELELLAPPPAPAEKPTDDKESEIDEVLVAVSIPDTDGPVWVTPEMAELWLTRNTNNRNVRLARVAALSRDMAADKWVYTGEAVKFDVDGRLIDGQHRLMAVIASGATVRMLVLLGLPADSQAFMDAGAPRTAGDALAFQGETNAKLLGAAVRFAITYENRKANTRETVTHAEIIEWLTEHPDIRRYVGVTVRYSKRIDMKPSVFAYGLWRLFKIDERDAMGFLSAIVEMRSLGSGDPIYTFLQRFRTARKNRENVLAITELTWLFRTWNAMRAGHQLKVLKTPASDWDVVDPR